MAELLAVGAAAAALAGLGYAGTLSGKDMPVSVAGMEESASRNQVVRIPWSTHFPGLFKTGPADLNATGRNFLNNERYLAWRRQYWDVIQAWMANNNKSEAAFYEEVYMREVESGGDLDISQFSTRQGARNKAAQMRVLANMFSPSDQETFRKITNTITPKVYGFVNGSNPSVGLTPYYTALNDTPYRVNGDVHNIIPANGRTIIGNGFMSTENRIWDNIHSNAGVQPPTRHDHQGAHHVTYPSRQSKSVATGFL